MLKDLNFNISAFIKPSNPKEYSNLLDEALSELDHLGELIDKVSIELENKSNKDK